MENKNVSIEKSSADNSPLKYRNSVAKRALITIVWGVITASYPKLALASGIVPGLDMMWENYVNHIKRGRDLLADTVKEEVTNSDVPIDQDYVNSKAFFDLIGKAVEATDRTDSEEKIKLLAKILAGAIVIQDRTANSPSIYMSLLADLSAEEIGLAKALYAQSKFWKRFDGDTDEKRSLVFELPKSAWEALNDSCPFLTEEDLPFYLTRLQRTGLIKTYGATTAMDYPNGEQYVFTKTFSKIVAYVNENWEKLGSDEHETRSTNL